jgi:hypothetical protein
VSVEPQAFDVLAHLVCHRDRVPTKEELLVEVWGDRFVSESALPPGSRPYVERSATTDGSNGASARCTDLAAEIADWSSTPRPDAGCVRRSRRWESMDMGVAMRIGLVGCVNAKRSEPSPARDLYVSPLFRGRVAYVERTCDQWFVLPAKYGLVRPDTVIAPYDAALSRVPAERGVRWSAMVLSQLQSSRGDLGQHTFEVHAGAPYRTNGLVQGLQAAGAVVEIPMENLRIGRQLQRYLSAGAGVMASAGAEQHEQSLEVRREVDRPATGAPPHGRGSP